MTNQLKSAPYSGNKDAANKARKEAGLGSLKDKSVVTGAQLMVEIAGASLHWVAWQWVYVVASRVIFVWIYNNAGKSLVMCQLIHPYWHACEFVIKAD